MSVSIEGVALEHCSLLYHPSPLFSLYHVSLQVVFRYFLSDNSKQDAATTAEHSKRIIENFQSRTVLSDDISTILENTDGCVEKYRCVNALYLLSMF